MKAIYFSHDTNSFYDPKIRYIVGEHGVWSYAVFWVILEMMASQRDYRIRKIGFLNGLLPLLQGKHISYKSDGGIGCFEDSQGKQLSVEEAHHYSICLSGLEALLASMISIGLFIESEDGYLYSESLLIRMKIKDKISLKRMKSGKLGGEANAKQIIENRTSKHEAVKESKVKESKGNDKDTIVSPTRKIQDFFYKQYLGVFGDAYVANFAKDGAIFKDLLKTIPEPRLQELIEFFFQSQDEFIKKTGYTVGVFRSQINKLKNPASEAETPSSRRGEYLKQQLKELEGNTE